MSTFTTEVRRIESQVRELGLSDYPIFNENYRDTLNDSIINTYKYREIGFETVDQFVNRLDARMKLIMPAYNKLYESTLLDFDPMIGTRFKTTTSSNKTETETSNATTESTANTEAANNSKSRSVTSDFPQMQLQENQDYATGAADSVSDSTSSSDGTESSTQVGTNQGEMEGTSETLMEGLGALPAHLLLSYRETIINVDRTVVSELGDLFMKIWNTGQEYGDYPNIFYPIFPYGGF